MRCGFLDFGCLWILPSPATNRTYMENIKVCSEIAFYQNNFFGSLELIFADFLLYCILPRFQVYFLYKKFNHVNADHFFCKLLIPPYMQTYE
jgi:hypothetical protein